MDRYGVPQAFRTAPEDRLRNLAQRQGIDLQRLRRRVAFERLLAHLFEDAGAPGHLKGGFALELRLQDRARSTVDLDLTVTDPDRVLIAQNAENLYPLTQQSAEQIHACTFPWQDRVKTRRGSG